MSKMESDKEKRKQLSALVDDELDHDISSMVDNILKDHEAKRTWERYHIISDALRGRLPKYMGDVFDNVTQAIASEPTILAPKKKFSYFTKPIISKPVMRFAIAASVAVVVIFSVQQGNQIPRVGQPVVTQSSISTNPPSSTSLTESWQLVAQTKDQDQIHQAGNLDLRLNKYLINHNEYRLNLGINIIPPYVRMVANESESSK